MSILGFLFVTPAEAGVHFLYLMDVGFRRHDSKNLGLYSLRI
jgi:hypothetical protein